VIAYKTGPLTTRERLCLCTTHRVIAYKTGPLVAHERPQHARWNPRVGAQTRPLAGGGLFVGNYVAGEL